MLIAKRTKETNIAEHVIYMFQIEDLIRANNLDLDAIIYNVIQPQIQDEDLIDAYTKWYAGLIKQMKSERIETKGHLSEVNEILMELLLLHNTLINISKEKKYLQVFEKALPALKEFQQKSDAGDLNLVEVAFNALYGKLILRLKKVEISEASEQGFEAMSNLLGTLAHFYKRMKSGDMNFANN
ncbi:DUF4924 family protein [Crocinitomix algicola]|uniref:DUF4924 family protein n=1 Tax=Crocinitomix algicola TaxID=1740263 RepID=UPI0008730078|nr:DUF4924 family protein [Crocinitomix algicola]